MHEYSIVLALLDQCHQQAQQHQADSVKRVSIKVGVLSGVEPDLLATAFDTFKLEGICREAELEMHIQPLVLKCNDCQKTQTIEEYSVLCPDCGGRNTQVVDGEDMYLMQLELGPRVSEASLTG
ncbi:hydrogenase maturation nickel metallochaperone HypA [Paraferrimonas sedimenticola]|uniref:Hydrogenase maturation factor HypA n=1 Tax=Paraferrimonas sedimenticola TaxID=375674 RepID=A0AA37RYI7_9GAMM|nr:hydrogenase maturation nickel metallochaperone HypA [Paraferrimonas sedimenticola]GLP97304.1 putative hydrogenase nickel incorporation protein HypA [Paraferrimonas sedimenticola]